AILSCAVVQPLTVAAAGEDADGGAVEPAELVEGVPEVVADRLDGRDGGGLVRAGELDRLLAVAPEDPLAAARTVNTIRTIAAAPEISTNTRRRQ
ncbi:MAG: hypothetical protein JO147_09060, partial [Actinobacteria bacterium]|nr:hypothetical protein [Actinomycetota bacterium]